MDRRSQSDRLTGEGLNWECVVRKNLEYVFSQSVQENCKEKCSSPRRKPMANLDSSMDHTPPIDHANWKTISTCKSSALSLHWRKGQLEGMTQG